MQTQNIGCSLCNVKLRGKKLDTEMTKGFIWSLEGLHYREFIWKGLRRKLFFLFLKKENISGSSSDRNADGEKCQCIKGLIFIFSGAAKLSLTDLGSNCRCENHTLTADKIHCDPPSLCPSARRALTCSSLQSHLIRSSQRLLGSRVSTDSC